MGEFDLIAKIRDRIGRPAAGVIIGPGDDAAVAHARGVTVTTVDAAVEGVHFRRDRATAPEIGYKALVAAASDLAAMGAEPGEVYVALGMPLGLGEEAAIELLDGLLEGARDAGLALAGGDIVGASELFISVTAVGHAATAERLVTRGGARPGELVVLTGALGAAAAGAELLERTARDSGPAIDPGIAEAVRYRQFRPPVRLGAGRALARSRAGAMIDLSDGLGADAGHIAEASDVCLAIELRDVPVAAGVTEVAEAIGLDRDELVATGGEDYELLATLAPERVAGARVEVEAAGAELHTIGEVRPGSGVELRSRSGRPIRPRGFDQLARQIPQSGTRAGREGRADA